MNSGLLRESTTIGQRIASAAVWQSDQCFWPQDAAGQSAPYTVYEGSSGIGWFLANLSRVTGERAFRTTALGAARFALSRVADRNSAPIPGFHEGDLGALWAVAETARLLGESTLLAQASASARRAAESHSPTQHPADLVGGGAGSLLALVSLARIDPSLRDTARRAGEHLSIEMAPRLESPELQPALPQAEPIQIGLAHGVSGVGWALLELNALVPDDRFRRLALDAFRYERAWFDPRLCAWRDPVTVQPAGPSWCRGVVGIGLARLRAVELLPDPHLRAETGAALAAAHGAVAIALTTPQHPVWELANCSMCHGLIGLADLLLFAAHVLGVDEHRVAAARLIEHCRSMTASRGRWPCGTLDRSESFGLMLGLAGIGAVLLRFAVADRTPPIGLLGYSTSPSF